jgi:hypothetical protein
MRLATRLLAGLKAAAAFALRRPKDALVIALAVVLAFLAWRLGVERRRSRELAAKLEGLPPGTQQLVTVYRDRVVTKWREGPSRIEYRERYLPPEGKLDLVIKDGKPEAEVVIKDRGFTRRWGAGVVYAGEALPVIDLKWAYWRRYSLTMGLTPRFGGLGLSRHVDDFTPLQNLEVLGIAGPSWRGDLRFGLGLRTNF